MIVKTSYDLNITSIPIFKRNWIIGKLLGLDVSMNRVQMGQRSFCCFVKTKDKDSKEVFIPFDPINDWRICGLIVEKYGFRIDNDPRHIGGTQNPWNWSVQYKGKDKIWHTEYGVNNIKDAICRAFMCLNFEETKELIQKANDTIKGF